VSSLVHTPTFGTPYTNQRRNLPASPAGLAKGCPKSPSLQNDYHPSPPGRPAWAIIPLTAAKYVAFGILLSSIYFLIDLCTKRNRCHVRSFNTLEPRYRGKQWTLRRSRRC
jgi:hypothetical protein